MSEQDLSKKILEIIEKKELEPKAKLFFVFKNALIMLFGFVFLVLGAMAVAIIIYMFKTNDWDVYHYINNSLIGFIFVTLPYVWLTLLTGVIIGFYFYFRKTDKGYRFRLLTISLVAIIISSLLGGVFYAIGMGDKLNTIFSRNIPHYNEAFYRKAHNWCQPDQGRIGGVVVQVIDDKSFLLHDIKKNKWLIIKSENAKVLPAEIQPRLMVRIIGQKIDQDKFEATAIMPFNKIGPKLYLKDLPERMILPVRNK